MTERSVSRRDVLRTASGLAAVGSLGSFAGCSEVTESLGGGGSKPSIETVPENSQYVVETDFTVIYEDDGLREGVNEELSEVRSEMQSQNVPENVTAALDQIETEAGLDPRSMSKAILSGTYEDGSDTDQVAYTLWSEWTEEDLLATIEDEGGSYTEDSYGDTTLYVEGESMGEPAVLGVLAEGVFTVGTRTHVEATIDTFNGDADPISGEVKSGYDASTDDHVRYAFDVVASEVPESAGAQFDTGVFKEVTYGYGSISQDGSDRVATLQLEASSEDAATDMSDILQGALTLVEQQIEASETEDTEEIMAALEATEISADGTTTAVTHTRPASEFAAVATPILLSFVLPQGMSRTSSASSAETAPAAPQAAFEFQFYGGSGDQNQVAISHQGGDSIPASQLFVRGSGFISDDAADMDEPGPWQGTTTDGNVTAGDIVYVGVSSDCELSMVWQSESEDTSAVLAEFSGPDA